jgi:SAM-dependent methyltransferase
MTAVSPAAAAAAGACPLCGSATRPLFRVRGHVISGCDACGHRSAEATEAAHDHLARVYGNAYFTGGGAGYPDYLAEAALLRAHGRRYARLLRRYRTPGQVLDVGAAAGFLLDAFIEDGWGAAAVEPNRHMAALIRDRLGITVYECGLESVRCTRRFDLVTMVQVLPHFIDPRAALAVAASLTAPGGCWLVETWNRDDIAARLLGRRWHEYNPPSVLHWFNPAGLRALAASFGFVELARGRPRKRLSGAHLKSALRHQWSGPLAARAFGWIPDHLQVPYPLTDVFWALFRRA